VIVLALVFVFAPVPDIKAEDDYPADSAGAGESRSIWSHPHFVFAVAAQFFYVAAQAGIFSFFINYMTAEVPAIPVAWNEAMTGLSARGWVLGDWLSGWFQPGRAACWRSATRGPRTWRRSGSCAS